MVWVDKGVRYVGEFKDGVKDGEFVLEFGNGEKKTGVAVGN